MCHHYLQAPGLEFECMYQTNHGEHDIINIISFNSLWQAINHPNQYVCSCLIYFFNMPQIV